MKSRAIWRARQARLDGIPQLTLEGGAGGEHVIVVADLPSQLQRSLTNLLQREGRAVVEPGFAVLQIMQIADIVGGEIAFFRLGQPGIEQAVDIVNLGRRWIEDGYRMRDAAPGIEPALIQARQVVGRGRVDVRSVVQRIV